MQEKEILEGRTMGGGEREMGKGREEEGESGQITPSSTSPAFSNNKGFDEAERQETVLKT